MDPIESETKRLKDCYHFINQWVEAYSLLCPDCAAPDMKNEMLKLFHRMYNTELREFLKSPHEYVEEQSRYDLTRERGKGEELSLLSDVPSFDVSESMNNDRIGDQAVQICKEPNNIHLMRNPASRQKDKREGVLENFDNYLLYCHLYVLLDVESWEPLEELKSFCKTENIKLGLADNFLTPRDTELVNYANKTMNKFIDLWELKREFIRKREYWKFITVRGAELAILSDFDKSTISELFSGKSMYATVGEDEIIFFKTGIGAVDEKLSRQLNR